MTDPLTIAIGVVLASGVVGLLRVAAGPTPFDRMLAAQLLGTSLVAVLVLAAHAWDMAALRDVALLVALLAAVAAIAMVKSEAGGTGE
jgi:multicomponent Na+:H+ antiporter subunit F